VDQNTESAVSPSEALYAFMGWLTARPTPVTFSGCHHAGEAVDLISQFVKNQGWDEPRDGWDKRLKTYPKHETESEVRNKVYSPSSCEEDLRMLILMHNEGSKTDTPDFILAQYLSVCLDNYNNTVVAKHNWHVARNMKSTKTPEIQQG